MHKFLMICCAVKLHIPTELFSKKCFVVSSVYAKNVVLLFVPVNHT